MTYILFTCVYCARKVEDKNLKIYEAYILYQIATLVQLRISSVSYK